MRGPLRRLDHWPHPDRPILCLRGCHSKALLGNGRSSKDDGRKAPVGAGFVCPTRLPSAVVAPTMPELELACMRGSHTKTSSQPWSSHRLSSATSHVASYSARAAAAVCTPCAPWYKFWWAGSMLRLGVRNCDCARRPRITLYLCSMSHRYCENTLGIRATPYCTTQDTPSAWILPITYMPVQIHCQGSREFISTTTFSNLLLIPKSRNLFSTAQGAEGQSQGMFRQDQEAATLRPRLNHRPPV